MLAKLQSNELDLTFLDFLAHVPLFVDIHNDIAANPMATARACAREQGRAHARTRACVLFPAWTSSTRLCAQPAAPHPHGLQRVHMLRKRHCVLFAARP